MSIAPERRTRQDRLSLAHEITDRARIVYADRLKAAGIYGSTARGTDGPFSDLEMLCVLRTTDEDYSCEWCAGPWKAEVNFQSENLVLEAASTVEGDWSLTHGSYAVIYPTFDPGNFFLQLKQAVEAPGSELFHRAIREVIVGELYEWIGKLRNAIDAGKTAHVPELALNLAKYGALIVGLSHRHLYTSGSKVFEEVFALPRRPSGYDQLCRLAMSGALSDTVAVADACEVFWNGVVDWAAELGIEIVETRRVPF